MTGNGKWYHPDWLPEFQEVESHPSPWKKEIANEKRVLKWGSSNSLFAVYINVLHVFIVLHPSGNVADGWRWIFDPAIMNLFYWN